MKLAYIITAYTDANQLKRLINSLNSNADFYCHIDKKTDIQPFIELLGKYKNVHFSATRYFVNWGSFAQVLSQKELIRMVLESHVPYQRVVCLSGLDYPVYSNIQIAKIFAANPLKEHICGVNISKKESKMLHDRINIYHFGRDVKVKNTFLKKCCSGTSRIIMRILPIRKKTQVVICGKPADVYMGSDYWALTYPCIQYVYKRMCTEKALMNYFRYSFVPSEMCIQTIVFNSQFAAHAIPCDAYTGLPPLTPLHFIDYNKRIEIFNESDFEKLTNSKKMFFRKAATGRSEKLLELIDQFRLQQELEYY